LLNSEINNLLLEQSKLNKELSTKENEENLHKKELERVRSDSKLLNSVLERIKSTTYQINEISVRLMGVDLDRTLSEVELQERDIVSKLDLLSMKKKTSSDLLTDKNIRLVETEKKIAVFESKTQELVRKLGEFQRVELEIEAIKSKYGLNDLHSEILALESNIKSKDETYRTNVAGMESKRRHLEELTSMEKLCPLCKKNLNELERSSLVSSIKKELAEILYENNRITLSIDDLKKRKKDLDEVLSKYTRDIDTLSNKSTLVAEKDRINKDLKLVTQSRTDVKSHINLAETSLKEIEYQISMLREQKDKILNSKHLYELKSKKIKLENDLVSLNSEKSLYDIDPEKISSKDELQSAANDATGGVRLVVDNYLSGEQEFFSIYGPSVKVKSDQLDIKHREQTQDITVTFNRKDGFLEDLIRGGKLVGRVAGVERLSGE